MPQVSDTSAAGQPPSDWPPADAPSYHYNPHLGGPKDKYARVDINTSRLHHPELAGRFAAYVYGETATGSAVDRRTLAWRAEPGTPCLILGYWSDGTVNVKWRVGYYTLNGRFPPWVVEEDTTAKMAGGGRILDANTLLPLPRGVSAELVRWIVVVLVRLVLVLLPPAREAIGAALSALFQLGP
jgi:hypothetical protein